jgi:hypothetical protein
VTVRLPAPGPIAGATALPAGFAHPHASEEARLVAEAGLILRVQVGSGVHGTAIAGSDDRDEMGLCLEPPRFVTGLAAARYLGYLQGQKAAMTGQAGAHTNRPELVAVHGYDTKYAMHALRLGLQGIELLTTGRITLPVPEPDRGYLRSIRRGERPLAEVLDAVTETEARLEELRDSAAVPDEPDRGWVDDWLHRSYLYFWASLR